MCVQVYPCRGETLPGRRPTAEPRLPPQVGQLLADFARADLHVPSVPCTPSTKGRNPWALRDRQTHPFWVPRDVLQEGEETEPLPVCGGQGSARSWGVGRPFTPWWRPELLLVLSATGALTSGQGHFWGSQLCPSVFSSLFLVLPAAAPSWKQAGPTFFFSPSLGSA